MASFSQPAEHVPVPVQPPNGGLYPAHFQKGALIELASGLVKRVEDLTVEDFRRSTELSPDLQLDVSTVDHIAMKAENTMTLVHFVVGSERLEITVEAPVEHPFLVYDKGWCSVNPEMSLQRYKLHCQPLLLGDRCASLTLKQPPTEAVPAAYKAQASSTFQGISASI